METKVRPSHGVLSGNEGCKPLACHPTLGAYNGEIPTKTLACDGLVVHSANVDLKNPYNSSKCGEVFFNTRELVDCNLRSCCDIVRAPPHNIISNLQFKENIMYILAITTAHVSMLVGQQSVVCFDDHILLNGTTIGDEIK